MDRKLISHRIGSILDDISRLSNALYALDTTDIQRYPDNYETLSIDAALRAERIACRLRHLIYSSTTIRKGDYQILTSTGGAKHDYFMLDGSYDHFYFLTNDHQGEVILALLCDPVKTAELDRILSQGLYAGNPGRAMEQDAAEPDGTPVLFGYFCDLPRIVRFNTALELMERPGTLICFDFQADVLRRYCSDRVHLQTIDFTKFEGRLFP